MIGFVWVIDTSQQTAWPLFGHSVHRADAELARSDLTNEDSPSGARGYVRNSIADEAGLQRQCAPKMLGMGLFSGGMVVHGASAQQADMTWP